MELVRGEWVKESFVGRRKDQQSDRISNTSQWTDFTSRTLGEVSSTLFLIERLLQPLTLAAGPGIRGRLPPAASVRDRPSGTHDWQDYRALQTSGQG